MTDDAWPGYRPSVKKGLSGSVKALRAQFAMFRDGTQMQLYTNSTGVSVSWNGCQTVKARPPLNTATLQNVLT